LLIALIAVTAWSETKVADRARRLAERELAFVAGVSHELRTPLATIRGAGHNLRSKLVQDVEKQRVYGDLIVERADQLIAMVEQLLSLASLRRSTHPAAPMSIILSDLLHNTLRVTSDEVTRSGCRTDVNIPADLPPVLGDPTALGRVFQNLIVNAATHAAAGGWIGLTARSVSRKGVQFVEVSVADRGPGVSTVEQERIWEPFVRGAAGASGPHRGFGLGLSLVREIVEQHGGTVSLRSRENDGVTFTVCLPAERVAA
jgi:two-component system phosphate regulon sensor histidine kinase PhoR